jgi:hypothetical protein
MRTTRRIAIITVSFVVFLLAKEVLAQSATNLNAFSGLSPVSALQNTTAGKIALARNLTITAAIQNGSAQQPTLLTFSEQQQLALRDAFITDENAYELADGLGTELDNVYRSLTKKDGYERRFNNISAAIAQLIARSLTRRKITS